MSATLVDGERIGMDAQPGTGLDAMPDWVVREMPSGYQTRLAEIQRLSADIRDMDRIGRLLWDMGRPLQQAVHDAFTALHVDVDPITPDDWSQMAVRLDGRRRLLVLVTDAESPIQKQSRTVEQVFQLVHKIAGEGDRVVLVANVDRMSAPAGRSPALAADAQALLQRLGVNFLPSPALFAVWMLSLQDQPRGRAQIEQLHALDGGIFAPPSAA